MRKELKNLWDEITKNTNDNKKLFELISILYLFNISTEEFLQLKEYAQQL